MRAADADTGHDHLEGLDRRRDRQPAHRALFALRFGDFNLLISNQLTDDSQILFRRDIEERVRRSRPSSPTTTTPTSSAPTTGCSGCGTPTPSPTATRTRSRCRRRAGSRGTNYLRNSVKVVIDAYDGNVNFFITDPDEPIIAAYARIFPDLFEPLEAMPDELSAHLRYPEDLFAGAERVLPALPPAGDRRRGHDLLQPGRSLGDPGGRVAGRRPADGAVLRDHAHPRRGRRRVRPHPADGAGGRGRT